MLRLYSNIKQRRIELKMSQEELAKKVGYSSRSMIAKIEAGKIDLYQSKIDEIAKALDTKSSILMGYDVPIEKTQTDNVFSTKGKEPEIVRYYNQLNSTGKQEATKRVEELTYIDKYIDPTAPVPPLPMRYINYYYRLASAGTGEIIFDTPPTKSIEIPDIPKYKKVNYAIGVNGNSMSPRFEDGDTLLVEMTQTINIGEIGIFQVDGKCYVKKLGKKELISLNKEHKNIPLNETATCMGKVVDKLHVE